MKIKMREVDSGIVDSSDQDILRRDITAEADAITLYIRQADKAKDDKVKKLLIKIANEEKEHMAEFVNLLKMMDSTFDSEMKKPLEHML